MTTYKVVAVGRKTYYTTDVVAAISRGESWASEGMVTVVWASEGDGWRMVAMRGVAKAKTMVATA